MDPTLIVATLLKLIDSGKNVAPFVAKLFSTFGPGAPPATIAGIEEAQAMEANMVAGVTSPFPEDGI